MTAAQKKCDESEAVSAKDAREVAEDLIVEVEVTKAEIVSGKEQVDEEVQEYFVDQDQIFKDLEKAQKDSIASLQDQQR